MVESSSFKTKLIDFSSMGLPDNEQLNCCSTAFNSFMLRIQDFENYKEVQGFTHCQSCKMILTDKDYSYIDDWNLISQNEKHFSDIPDKIKKIKEDPWAYYIWQCRFCSTKNLVRTDEANFAPNKSKMIIRDGIPKSQVKEYSQSPLLLFLVDSSSSMDEQLSEFSDPKNWGREVYIMINEMLKKTKIYQKIVANQEQRLKAVRKMYSSEQINKEQYKDHLSKNKVLMSLLQLSIKDIKDLYKNLNDKKKLRIDTIYENKQLSQRKVGFIFFNSDVIIHKKNAITVSDKGAFRSDISSGTNLKVDFNNFKDLFQLGRNQSQQFGIEISNFSFEDIDVNKNMANPSGQTALGPALTMASGIVSNFGPGSLVVVITDGRANKGIFREDQFFNNEINLLNMKFDKAKTQVCLIQLDKKNEQINPKEKQIQSSLSKYFRKYCQRIIIQLDNKQSPFQLLKTRLKDVINKTKDKNVVNQVNIMCQNGNVDYQSNLKNIKKKLFNAKQYQFVAPKIKNDNLKTIDYKHPFMTQIIVKYQDIETKQEQICLTYMIQKLIKYKEMTKKERQSMNSPQTLMNVLNYFYKQEEKLDLENIPLSMSQLSFKSMIESSFSMSINREAKMNMMKDFQQEYFFDKKEQSQRPKNAKELIKQYQMNPLSNQNDQQAL